jgi:N6-adenosine-specific RNA methylase IME4
VDKVTFNRDKKFDLQLSASLRHERKLADIITGGKIELKTETWQREQTGNICIEYACDSRPSGIATTEADIWVHELRRDDARLSLVPDRSPERACPRTLQARALSHRRRRRWALLRDPHSTAGNPAMKKHDEAFTKIAGKLLTGVRDLVDWGIEGGHTTAEQLRLTVQARREAASKLVQAGASKRQAAKVLGVDESTVRADLRGNPADNAGKSRTTKAEKRAQRELDLATKQTALPAKRYGVILADPEWRFEPYSRETGMDRAADNHYPTSITDEIAKRDVPSIAADDCVLFLWATVPMLRDALHVMEAWGFAYKSQAIWDKVHIGTGFWFCNRHELLLVGTKGEIPAPAMGEQFASLLTIARKEHSAKPDQFLELIEQYFPHLPKIELNRRGDRRPGWDAWGNEVQEAAE